MHQQSSSESQFKAVDRKTGVGSLQCAGEQYTNVKYDFTRFQAMTRAGLPVPGLHRLDGQIALSNSDEQAVLVGQSIVLILEDGTSMNMTVTDESGRILARGHGPQGCGCC